MKKLLFTFLLSSSLFAQEKATDLFNANISVIGIGIQYEKALSDNFTAVGSLDYAGGFSYSNNDFSGSDFDYILTTSLSLEGRYYYNFDRRIGKGRNTKNNSGNYIALKGNFIPDWLTASNGDRLNVNPQGSLTVNYGLKRSFAQNFFYEFYTGLGLAFYQEDKLNWDNELQNYNSSKKTEIGTTIDLGFRVGYNF
ncbi:hypothetical protein [Algoriella sp.]|uniref:hypothetical protein n=1 Tax=Algoriella sp. TaxID=1872434 RepID=UPI002FCB6883